MLHCQAVPVNNIVSCLMWRLCLADFRVKRSLRIESENQNSQSWYSTEIILSQTLIMLLLIVLLVITCFDQLYYLSNWNLESILTRHRLSSRNLHNVALTVTLWSLGGAIGTCSGSAAEKRTNQIQNLSKSDDPLLSCCIFALFRVCDRPSYWPWKSINITAIFSPTVAFMKTKKKCSSKSVASFLNYQHFPAFPVDDLEKDLEDHGILQSYFKSSSKSDDRLWVIQIKCNKIVMHRQTQRYWSSHHPA
jgi:hypothetical protein